MRKLISGAFVVAALLALSSTAASGAVPVLRAQPAPDAIQEPVGGAADDRRACPAAG